MAGIPPLMGFFSKQLVLSAAIENGYYFISIVAILVSVISASYYLKIVKVLFSSKEENISIDKEYTKIDINETLNTNLSALVTHINNKTIYNSLYRKTNKGNNNNLYFAVTVDHIISNFHSFLISSLTLSIVLFIFKPSILLNSCQLLSLSFYHF